MRTTNALAHAVLVVASVSLVGGSGACDAFSGDSGSASDDAGKTAADASGDAGAAGDATPSIDDASADTGGGDAAPADAGDACTTVTFAATADTYVYDSMGDGGCDAPDSQGAQTQLRMKNATPTELAVMRFQLDAKGAALFADSKTTAQVVLGGATCSGTCVGSLHGMRSDWDEGTGTSNGADFCRRLSAGSAGWGNGNTLVAISSADYDTAGPSVSFDATSSTFTSAPLSTAVFAARVDATNQVSFVVSMTTAGEVVAASRESGALAPRLVLRSCPP